MRPILILSNLRISTKLLLLNLMICAAFILIVCVAVVSFYNIRHMSTDVANRDIGRVIDNSRTARELGKVFADIDLLSRTFYGRDDYLESEGSRLLVSVKSIAETTTDPDLKKSLLTLSEDLASFLSQCAAVNTVLYARQYIDGKTNAELTRLENMIGELLVNLTLKGEDTSFVEQLLTLVVGYRESLLNIGKLYAELGHRHYFIPLQGKRSPVIADIDDLILRLQTISASIPDVARYGKKLVSHVQKYKGTVLRVYEVMEELGSRMTGLNHSKNRSMSALESTDQKISETTQRVSNNIEKIILSSGSVVLIMSIIVIALLSFGTTYLIKSNINSPMKEILKGIDSFRKGNFETQVELSREDEWDTIEKALNNMATDLLKSYTALRDSEKRFRELAELLPQPVFELDLEGNLRYSNRCGFETFGYTQADLELGLTALQLYIPKDRERVKQNIGKRLAGEAFEDHEYIGLRKDGSTFPILVYSAPIIREDKAVGVRGTVLDITERKRAEEVLRKSHDELERRVEERTLKLSRANEQLKQEIAERKRTGEQLRESEERYRTVLEASPDPVVVYDMEGKVLYFNPAFTDVFGWTLTERLGKKMDVFVPEENLPETKMMIQKALVGESFFGIETRRYTKERNIIPVSVSGAVYRDRDGKPRGSVANLRDISGRKTLESQLLQAQKMEAIGTLAGGIAHDFNNLLQAVQGYAELLLLDKKSDESGYRELHEIVRASRRGGELVQQLLTFGRKVESKLRPVDLNHEVEQVKALLERTIPKMIAIEVALQNELWIVNADSTQIEQVLMNLAINAKDAMPDGGRLTIQAANVILDEEYCRLHAEAKPGDYVLLSVSDTGRGMDKTTLEHIFEPFYTTKGLAEGTGLGLAMVYGIVKSHGGYITCSSDLGMGTTFEMYFPAIEQEVESWKTDELSSPTGGTEKILLVDDEKFIRGLGRQTLARFGYTVITASDGESTLDIYRTEKEQIDLIVLDLIMPGMGGRKCLEELLKIKPEAKVLIASGYSEIGPMRETIEAGAKSFIGKPYQVREMLRAVREVLDEE